ncbi:DUF3987 domain-containing protein [Tolypothrix sp. VBCCA 56010]|uniref:DUF3987 domain-containing protein n=1 Tax=Tolypothrix sp. VBCCA 56010 TaxID=3137731 RepID=UPI003D7E6DAE
MQTQNLIHASKTNSCVHCGKTDWCYLIGDLSVCKRKAEPAKGWTKTSRRDKDGDFYYAPFQEKRVRPKAKKDYFYPSRDGSALIKVSRIDDGYGRKKFFQSHWDGQNWVNSNPEDIKRQIPVYRYQEVRKAIAAGELIFVVEGESVADTLWELGLAATTFIGGAGKYNAYGSGYKQDLAGASLVLCPDRDQPGVAHMREVAQDFPNIQWLYAPPTPFFWEHLPKSQGLDVGDWINDGATVPGIMQQIQLQPFTYLSSDCKVTGDSDSFGDSWVTATRSSRQTVQEVVTAVTTVLGGSLGYLEEKYALHQAYLNSGIDRRTFDDIVATEKLKLAQIEQETKEKLSALLSGSDADIDWRKALPTSLARDLIHDSEVLNVDPVVIWQTILSVCASLAGIRTKLDVESHKIPAIIWTATVAESGSGKTRGDGLGTAPLIEMQLREKTRYDEASRAYKVAYREWEKAGREGDEPLAPVMRKYLFDVATIQSVMKRCAENGENGALWARDELNGLFKSLGQFNSGGDEGLQILLKAWNGGSMSVDRVDISNSFFVRDSALSLTGGIQPGVFRESFKDSNDASGLQARFLFAVPARQRQSRRKSKGYCQLADKLPGLYRWLDELPATTVKLTPASDKLYTELVDLQEDELEKTSNPSVRAWLAKWSTHAMRIALVLHLIECYYKGLTPDCGLSGETLERGIAISQYYRSVFSSLQEKVSDNDELSTILLQIQDRSLKAPSGITMRDLYRSVKPLSKASKEEGVSVSVYTESLCSQLSSLGYGQVVRSERKVKYIAFVSKKGIGGSNIGDSGDSSHKSTVDDELQVSPELSPELSLSPLNYNCHLDTEEVPPPDDTSKIQEFSEEEVQVNAGYIREAIAEMNWKMIQELTDGWEPQFKRLVWRCLTADEKAIVKLLAQR